MAFHFLLVLAIVQVRTDIADEDDVEGEMKKVVSLVEPVCVIFPQSVLFPWPKKAEKRAVSTFVHVCSKSFELLCCRRQLTLEAP